MKIRILRRRGLGNGSTLGIQQFSKNDIEIIRNDREIPQDTDLLIRWGCTSQFPSKKTLNKAEGITTIGNKYQSRLIMQNANISIPKLYTPEGEDIVFPVIIRGHHHHQGRHLYLANNHDELYEILNNDYFSNKPYYISEYINKDKEFGVFIFNNRVWSIIEKVKKEDNVNDNNIAWNVAQGNYKFVNVKWANWDLEIIKEALDAYKCFNIDFVRVDVMVKDGKPYILELNSAHSLTSDYRKKTFAKCLDYYIENGPVKKEIDINNIKSFKSIIHPALRVNNLGLNL